MLAIVAWSISSQLVFQRLWLLSTKLEDWDGSCDHAELVMLILIPLRFVRASHATLVRYCR
jgi:hypothetical protein